MLLLLLLAAMPQQGSSLILLVCQAGFDVPAFCMSAEPCTSSPDRTRVEGSRGDLYTSVRMADLCSCCAWGCVRLSVASNTPCSNNIHMWHKCRPRVTARTRVACSPNLCNSSCTRLPMLPVLVILCCIAWMQVQLMRCLPINTQASPAVRLPNRCQKMSPSPVLRISGRPAYLSMCWSARYMGTTTDRCKVFKPRQCSAPGSSAAEPVAAAAAAAQTAAA
jgi:hypothetical protein